MIQGILDNLGNSEWISGIVSLTSSCGPYLNMKAFKKGQYHETISGQWEQKKFAKLAPATTLANRDGATLQILVPSVLDIGGWQMVATLAVFSGHWHNIQLAFARLPLMGRHWVSQPGAQTSVLLTLRV